MDISLINSQSILRLLSLTEKKEELLQILEQIDDEIIRTLKGGVSVEFVEISSAPAIAAPAPAAAKPAAATKAPAKPAKARKGKAGRPGGLKDRILALLEAAGNDGIRVKDIAAKLGVKPTNVSVWFSTTGKKITTKLAPGRYASKGTHTPAKPVSASKPAKAAKARKAKRKSGLTPEGRAKLAANMKARWAARRAKAAAKSAAPAKNAAKPAKKTLKLVKKSK